MVGVQVTRGETVQLIMSRFGMSEKALLENNPSLPDLGPKMSVGTVLCVVPNWMATISGNGQKICIQ